ncbi:neural Wiskott-Aldrich syndrome protein-like [Notothenia coriiceps]|uniref:Neural Wiskott-Aldrich syndrome protein-like n=1 Tax=Notothenia coriiceps TaxID=8208 RepID=A0A6I9PR03_9TELE|nr:PREDICTED: neural Wiskott-Aldrich syndrome protein-like [Notothenia coriiceps]XP_010790121.1 PREDICTED: neural Wiskott-Aldrich syndrome protein-like [Notothenia coriiceps]
MNLTDCDDAFMKRESSSSSQVIYQELLQGPEENSFYNGSVPEMLPPPPPPPPPPPAPPHPPPHPPPPLLLSCLRETERAPLPPTCFVGLPDPEILHSCPSPSLQPPALSTQADSLKAKDCRDAPPETSVPYFSNNAP